MAGMSVSDAPVAVATLVAAPNPSMPPGRVRAMFKKLDANGDGVLTLKELEAGFEAEFDGGLPAHAKEAIPVIFDKAATQDEKVGEKVLKVNVFSRFYAEVLFMYFDKVRSRAQARQPYPRTALARTVRARVTTDELTTRARLRTTTRRSRSTRRPRRSSG